MASLIDMLTEQLQGGGIDQIGAALGTDRNTTQEATAAALSTLVGALSRNASREDGAQALHQDLEKDHDGSVLDDLGGLFGGSGPGPGEAILGHVLGSKRQTVERGLSQQTGLDGGSTGKLLAMLAPMVLGALGKAQRGAGLDSRGLSRLLNDERSELERRQPEAAGLVGRLLDTDGDGDVDLSDIAKHGAGILGKLFQR